MKKYIILGLLIAFAIPMMAQHDGPRQGKKGQADITELVSDLSAPQKRKVESISKESKERVDALRSSQRSVRDSIAMYMDREGDQSRYLNPLFDREAQLQAAISREMYSAKIRVDEVLTKEQRTTLRESLHRQHKRK